MRENIDEGLTRRVAAALKVYCDAVAQAVRCAGGAFRGLNPHAVFGDTLDSSLRSEQAFELGAESL